MPFEASGAELRRTLYTTVNARYTRAYSQTMEQAFFKNFCTEVPVSTKRVEFPFSILSSGMREWIGDRVVNQIEAGTWSFVIRDFEHTLGIKSTDLDDDQLGIYMPEIDGMGMRAAELPDQLTAEALIAGETTLLGYDGKPLFSATHPTNAVAGTGAGTYSNLHTSRALTPDNYEYGRTLMRTRKGPDGKNLNIRPRVLWCGPQLEGKAKRILENSMTVETAGDGAVDNIYKGTARLLVIDRLDDMDAGLSWGLMDDTRPMKPLIFATRQGPKLVNMNSENDEAVFMKRLYRYGVDCRYAVAPGMPQCIDKFTP